MPVSLSFARRLGSGQSGVMLALELILAQRFLSRLFPSRRLGSLLRSLVGGPLLHFRRMHRCNLIR
ncbi:hypothetical protein PATSB16_04700 [Pandoraea thiooxydans]|nr:hypothetical protein PATSB16_04700 [Pandoraea thiooxydans]